MVADAADITGADCENVDKPTPPPPPRPNVALGLQKFSQTCSGCHLNNGRSAGGVGPLLAGRGISEARVRQVVAEGPAVMPAGLIGGTDLDNVAAYVVSLQ